MSDYVLVADRTGEKVVDFLIFGRRKHGPSQHSAVGEYSPSVVDILADGDGPDTRCLDELCTPRTQSPVPLS